MSKRPSLQKSISHPSHSNLTCRWHAYSATNPLLTNTQTAHSLSKTLGCSSQDRYSLEKKYFASPITWIPSFFSFILQIRCSSEAISAVSTYKSLKVGHRIRAFSIFWGSISLHNQGKCNSFTKRHCSRMHQAEGCSTKNSSDSSGNTSYYPSAISKHCWTRYADYDVSRNILFVSQLSTSAEVLMNLCFWLITVMVWVTNKSSR